MQCIYCTASLLDGARLTLDHIKTVGQGGSNKTTNLITACSRCNSSRGQRSVREFAIAVAEYLNHGVRAAAIVRRVKLARQRAINRPLARQLVAEFGSAVKALAMLHNLKLKQSCKR